MKKIALLIFPTFSEFEITVATAVLRHTHEIITAALTRDVVISEAGLMIQPHICVDELVTEEYTALIIPGAADAASVMDEASVHQMIRDMDGQKKLIAAICAGPIILAKAGVLAKHVYTTSLYRQYRDYLGCFDESGFRQQGLVESENIITAQGFAFVEFGLRIGKKLNAFKDEEAAVAYFRGQGDIRRQALEKSGNEIVADRKK